MKYQDVTTMVQGGLLGATSHSLSLKGAYALTKFKVEASRLAREWDEKNESIAKEVGIENVEEFDNRRILLNDKKKDGTINKAEAKEFEEMTAKFDRAMGMRNEMNKEDVSISSSPMSYEDWHTLKEENKELKIGVYELFALVEPILENILWKAPEE